MRSGNFSIEGTGMLTDDQLNILVAILWNFHCFLAVPKDLKVKKRNFERSFWDGLVNEGYITRNEDFPPTLPIKCVSEITDKGREAVLNENPVRVLRACAQEKIYHIVSEFIGGLSAEYLPELLLFDEGDVTFCFLVQLFAYRRIKELRELRDKGLWDVDG
jgi:hypothetical protein